MITLLDGPMGTELAARGVCVDNEQWSAVAIDSAPNVVSEIHRDYIVAGATIHTANTFRTRRRQVGSNWRRLTERAVAIAQKEVTEALKPFTHFRSNAPAEQATGKDDKTAGPLTLATPQRLRIAGSLAPIADCYRPDQSPGRRSLQDHCQMARCLHDSGCDLIICETFANFEEAEVAVEQAIQTNCETWIALTAGPRADLMTPKMMANLAKRCVNLGCRAVIINCTDAHQTLPYLQAIETANLAVPLGVSANAGPKEAGLGWLNSTDEKKHAVASLRYLEFARQWVESGASILGGCCGTTPRHIKALAQHFKTTSHTEVTRPRKQKPSRVTFSNPKQNTKTFDE